MKKIDEKDTIVALQQLNTKLNLLDAFADAVQKITKIDSVISSNVQCTIEELLETDNLHLTEQGILAKKIAKIIYDKED